MIRIAIKISCFLILLVTTASVATPTNWQILKPGLEYTKIKLLSGFHIGYLHAFRIDLSEYELRLAIAEDDQNKIASVKDLTQNQKGIVGINGGFFSQELKPLGLRISNHQLRYPLKPTSWWGVFYINGKIPHIVSQKQFKQRKDIEFAVQSGPRLLTQGNFIHSLKPGIDSRTALGYTKDNHVIMVVTEKADLTTTQLAKLMHNSQIEGGLSCVDALNLDGGSSTQLYAATDDGFSLNISSYSAVTDAIIVVPRK